MLLEGRGLLGGDLAAHRVAEARRDAVQRNALVEESSTERDARLNTGLQRRVIGEGDGRAEPGHRRHLVQAEVLPVHHNRRARSVDRRLGDYRMRRHSSEYARPREPCRGRDGRGRLPSGVVRSLPPYHIDAKHVRPRFDRASVAQLTINAAVRRRSAYGRLNAGRVVVARGGSACQGAASSQRPPFGHHALEDVTSRCCSRVVCPRSRPSHAVVLDPVVGSAREAPVAHRRRERDGGAAERHAPTGRAERNDDLGASHPGRSARPRTSRRRQPGRHTLDPPQRPRGGESTGRRPIHPAPPSSQTSPKRPHSSPASPVPTPTPGRSVTERDPARRPRPVTPQSVAMKTSILPAARHHSLTATDVRIGDHWRNGRSCASTGLPTAHRSPPEPQHPSSRSRAHRAARGCRVSRALGPKWTIGPVRSGRGRATRRLCLRTCVVLLAWRRRAWSRSRTMIDVHVWRTGPLV